MHVCVSHVDSIGRSKISGSSFARYLLAFTEVRVQQGVGQNVFQVA